jgi:osmotically-inducible protein OsmY
MPKERKDVGSLVAVSLLKSEFLGRAEIEVEESDGIVKLIGIVLSREDKDTIEALVRNQEGVLEVINNLVVSDFLDEDSFDSGI